MSQIDELRGSTEYSGPIGDGINVLTLAVEVEFQKYSRVVLPLDGYIFWQPMDEAICVKGSVHFAQEIDQEETETYGAITVTFTTREPLVGFEALPPNTLHVGRIHGVRYAFSRQQGLFQEAGLWHYQGRSIPPALESQFLDTPGSIDPDQAVTSNSLALWLELNTFQNVLTGKNGLAGGLLLYPAGLVPPNLPAPYGVVKIEDTRALQAVPLIGPTSSSDQLNADRVRITLYGLQHNAGIDFLNAVLQYSLLTDNLGLMNMPTVIDGSRQMPELQAVALQKFVLFEMSYLQSRVNNVARKLIKSAMLTFNVS